MLAGECEDEIEYLNIILLISDIFSEFKIPIEKFFEIDIIINIHF